MSAASTIAFTDQSLEAVASQFVADVEGYTLAATSATTGTAAFLLTLTQEDVDIEKAQFPNEAYKIVFENGRVTVMARASTGVLWGTKTLLQLAKQVNYQWPTSGYIFDEPNDERRWFGVDCARHYFEPDFLKAVIRRGSNLKMNGLLLHAVDSEAFRYDIGKYPGLAPAGHGYNETVIGDLVDYGRKYGVEVMPGFEFPGHSAAMNLYFDVGVLLPGYESITVFVTDVTNNSTLDIVHDLISTVVPWFKQPKYIHLGGDEVPESIMQMYSPFLQMIGGSAFQDDVMLKCGFDAIALTAAKQWNRDTSQVYKSKTEFEALTEA
ncbi:glycoside hydrolase family 20 protein [Gregarina niphandrodes]|uniref:beta-N-acetylhexosaminidase n=1 Tax=Gregarina niphandrodes TaxID=110365 RepID=A0A023AY45_GRENI|nr:glycoside hydrolase family 20 protein [Gregarina niphandrodes]EZG43215.1 glycoside hydrolase family 20 protein [Gregarina niphandrodes]|eukprot:XP_011133527.1 glycoside hydrolase family 20 protein [Gregarina niphandrodes]